METRGFEWWLKENCHRFESERVRAQTERQPDPKGKRKRKERAAFGEWTNGTAEPRADAIGRPGAEQRFAAA